METEPTPAGEDPPDHHLEEQFESIELVEQCGDALREQAAAAAEEWPGLPVVGLVMECAAPDARRVLELMGLPPEAPAGKQFAGVLLREHAVKIVAEVLPAALDWLDDPTGEDPPRLPVVAILAHGGRVGYLKR